MDVGLLRTVLASLARRFRPAHDPMARRAKIADGMTADAMVAEGFRVAVNGKPVCVQ